MGDAKGAQLVLMVEILAAARQIRRKLHVLASIFRFIKSMTVMLKYASPWDKRQK